MRNLVTICADIGSSAKGKFAWWASSKKSGRSLESLADLTAKALNHGTPVALGFECPLFVTLDEDERSLTKARPGEGCRAWSAGAGCGALATGLVQVPWILSNIRMRLRNPVESYLNWKAFEAAGAGLFLWEAFVTRNNKGRGHMKDAQIGGQAFMKALPKPISMIRWEKPKPQIHSLIGLALLNSGWSSDPKIARSECLVVSPA